MADVPTPQDQHPTRHTDAGNGTPGSIWLTGQAASRDLRRHRYTPESLTHPGKMLPSIARYAIRAYSRPGEFVLDPMAGIATTVVEAMRLGRHGIGVEYEPRWAAMAAGNIALAERDDTSGTGQIYARDARTLPGLLPASLRGRVALVLTSPPYGSSTHGQVRTPGRRRGKVRQLHHTYGRTGNLAYRGHAELHDGVAEILTGCRDLLRPDGHVVITARPYRRNGELVDIPGIIAAAAISAGLDLVEECIALICGVRDGVIIPRASFFQQHHARRAIRAGDPHWLLQHEDVLILKPSMSSVSSGEPECSQRKPELTPTGRGVA